MQKNSIVGIHCTSNIDLNHIPQNIKETLRLRLLKDIVPLIKASCSAGMEILQVSEFNDTYTLGTGTWRNLFNRAKTVLSENKDWQCTSKNSDLIIRTDIDNAVFRFRIPKLKKDGTPSGCKSAKLQAINAHHAPCNLFLSKELEELAIRKHGALILGYNINMTFGLEKIVFSLLVYEGGRIFNAHELFVLYNANNDINNAKDDIVSIVPPKITRDHEQDVTDKESTIEKKLIL